MRRLTIIGLEKIATYERSTASNIHKYAQVYIHVVYTTEINSHIILSKPRKVSNNLIGSDYFIVSNNSA